MELDELNVVIVTYKSENKIISCIESLPANLKVYVVENSSDNDFKKKIESKFENVECILTGGNMGYAVGNNIGLKKVQTKYALVLNPDTVLSKETIPNFFESIKKNKDFWLIGPANDQSKNLIFKDKIELQVKNLKGFGIFFNLEKFKNNFFDENYFLYFEEIDLCKRVIKEGGKIYINKNIIIDHEGASSVKIKNEFQLEKNRNWHWMWSTFYFHKKFKGFILAFLIILPKLISSFLKYFLYLIILNNKKRDIYFCRMSGIFNSMIGRKSWYRPSID